MSLAKTYYAVTANDVIRAVADDVATAEYCAQKQQLKGAVIHMGRAKRKATAIKDIASANYLTISGPLKRELKL